MSDPTLAKQRTGPKIARLSIINLRLSIAYQPNLDPVLEAVKAALLNRGHLCQIRFVYPIPEGPHRAQVNPSSIELGVRVDTAENLRAEDSYWNIELELIELIQDTLASIDCGYVVSRLHKY